MKGTDEFKGKFKGEFKVYPPLSKKEREKGVVIDSTRFPKEVIGPAIINTEALNKTNKKK